jgi:hypothetical protein
MLDDTVARVVHFGHELYLAGFEFGLLSAGAGAGSGEAVHSALGYQRVLGLGDAPKIWNGNSSAVTREGGRLYGPTARGFFFPTLSAARNALINNHKKREKGS